MILHELTANMESFRPVRFKEGLNVVLAEKGRQSGAKDTRNGVGKTTLIEILMFCLGGQATEGKGIVQKALHAWSFTLDMTLKGKRIQVTRTVSEPGKILVDGDVEGWLVSPNYEYLGGTHVYDVSRWLDLLGWALFDLPPSVQEQIDHPVPKGLLSCFIRLGQNAYRNIDFHRTNKTDGKEAVNLAYLLRLDWEFIGRIKLLNEQLKKRRVAMEMAEEDAFVVPTGSIDAIKVEQNNVQAEIAELERALKSYDFSAQYTRLQEELNRLTQETLSLSNSIAANKRKVAIFQKAVREERDTSPDVIAKLYREVRLAFPNQLLQTLQDVQTFHTQIVQNRKQFLDAEIAKIKAEIETLTRTRDEKSKAKGQLATQFAAQNFFEELKNQQDKLYDLKLQASKIDNILEYLQKLEQKIADDEKAIAKEKNAVREDFEQRKTVLEPLLKDFAFFTNVLYGTPGKLEVFPDNDEYSFVAGMKRGGSDGVRLMGIFCFDLGLLKLQHEFDREMSLLVHDTPIFDAVDDRQRALALELAARETLAMHGQYICPMNSDKVPYGDFSKQFDFEAHVIHRLSDASPSDSLLGIHYEADS